LDRVESDYKQHLWGIIQSNKGGGWLQETDSGLTPSRLLLRLREARAAAAAAASGARRARAASAAAAEAAEARLGAALTAAQQRAHTRDELTRRLQAQFGQAQLRLVRALALQFATSELSMSLDSRYSVMS